MGTDEESNEGRFGSPVRPFVMMECDGDSEPSRELRLRTAASADRLMDDNV